MAFSSNVITSKQHGRARYARPNRNDVRGVVIHHMAGYFQGGLAQGLTGPYVAHFYIGNNQCVEVIPAEEQGYHAANSYYNNYFVGIEHANISLSPNWDVAESTLETSAKLMADLSIYYKWGKFELGKNVVTHTGVSQSGTSCPGPFMLRNLNRLIDKANAEIDKRNGRTTLSNTQTFPDKGAKVRVIGSNGLNVRKSPDMKAPIVKTIPKGLVFPYFYKKGDWGKSPSGWVNLKWTELVNENEFKVYVNAKGLRIRQSPSTSAAIVGVCPPGTYTIVEKKGDWGKLKSGAGWIFMGNGYAKKV